MASFSHFDEHGHTHLVDVSEKEVTARTARASGRVVMRPETLQRIQAQGFTKGNVLEVARLAGIMAAKRTGELIPLCHPLPLEAAAIQFQLHPAGVVEISAEVRITARTGVEMEALVAVATAALTIYDMCKSADREIRITEIQLEEKTGGRSGHFVRGQAAASSPSTT